MARITNRNVATKTVVDAINVLIDTPGVSPDDVKNILSTQSTTTNSNHFAGQNRRYYDCGGTCSWTASGR